MARDERQRRSIAVNRRARHDYEFLAEFEAGVVLRGSEVKTLRGGRGSIQEAYVVVKGGEAWLVGMHIPEYAYANRMNHPPVRDRKLLLHRREVEQLDKRVREKGLTVVPLEVLFDGHLVKVRIALVRGKKLHDKREDAKKRDAAREIDRALGRRR